MKDLLGKKVKDVVTGITGIATTRIEYMNGCVQYSIQPKVITNGVPADAKYYDEEQVVLIAKKKVVKKKKATTGGPPLANIPDRITGRI